MPKSMHVPSCVHAYGVHILAMHAVSVMLGIDKGGDSVGIKFLKTTEVAPLFRVDRSTIARWCNHGVFAGARQVGRGWLIPEPEVATMLTTKETS